MQINLEENETHAIQAYHDKGVMISNIIHETNLIINQHALITPWSLASKPDLNDFKPLLDLNPEIIIIGHNYPSFMLPPSIIAALSTQRIGVECMPLGPACRTYNILLSERRAVVLGILFS